MTLELIDSFIDHSYANNLCIMDISLNYSSMISLVSEANSYVQPDTKSTAIRFSQINNYKGISIKLLQNLDSQEGFIIRYKPI
jgi:hypothetical protein